VRIPVRVSKLDAAAASPDEQTVIEFGTPGEVLFASGLSLAFEDTVRVKILMGPWMWRLKSSPCNCCMGRRQLPHAS